MSPRPTQEAGLETGIPPKNRKETAGLRLNGLLEQWVRVWVEAPGKIHSGQFSPISALRDLAPK